MRERHGAADWVAEEGAGVDGLAVRWGPSGAHDGVGADQSGEGEPSGEGLAEADEVGDDVFVFAGEPAAGSAKAGVDFIENEQGAVVARELGEFWKESRGRLTDPAAGLDGFDEDGPDVVGLE